MNSYIDNRIRKDMGTISKKKKKMVEISHDLIRRFYPNKHADKKNEFVFSFIICVSGN